MERKKFTLLFIIKKSKLLKSGEAPIEMRLAHGTQKAEIRLGRSVLPEKWSTSGGGRVMGKDRRSNEINAYIDMARVKILTIQQEFERKGAIYNVKMIKDAYMGKGATRKTLYSVFKEHNDKCRQLIGKDYEEITIKRYDNCLKYLMIVVGQQFGKEDIYLEEINGELVRNFEYYLKVERGCAQNTVIRYMKCFKKVTNLAIANEWMSRNPFAGIKFKEEPVNKEFLTEEEVDKLAAMDFQVNKLNVVRDMFLFQIYTGLAYIDIYNLRPEHIVKDGKGNLWVHKAREKTDNMCDIPLFELPRQIIERYSANKKCIEKGVLLPVAPNQTMNAYLKQIATICGINKTLTTHTARRTFATTITLANDVSLSSVSRMLGHTTVRMTQRYAKVMESSILREMQGGEEMLNRRNGEK